ncbi:hypothetical protein LSH36_239g01067 [Paralvinella palmiformis]|uniref:Neuroguidin n=1 Tax=Paralvinella palmiformis TaxID=53620 RepID=A0AAD9N5W7_9ANNE|nr:hypothetical protein LSH36_239g01067 [Paralvinella palmiformis]
MSNQGVSFLEVKYQMLLSYLINLTYLMSVKIKGLSIKDDPAIKRLVEIRTVLEKMRPIDQKLKYQIDKLLKTAATGAVGENDPLRFKPNPDNLQSKLHPMFCFSLMRTKVKKVVRMPASQRFINHPKLSAVYYDGDDTTKQKQEKQLQRAKKRALSSSVIRELKEEYYDGPEEIKEDKAGKERTEYEEKYLLRTAVSKKEKNAARKLRTGLDDVMRFGNISALIEEAPNCMEDGMPTKKRKKASLRGKKKGKGSKKYKRRK